MIQSRITSHYFGIIIIAIPRTRHYYMACKRQGNHLKTEPRNEGAKVPSSFIQETIYKAAALIRRYAYKGLSYLQCSSPLLWKAPKGLLL